MIKISLEGHNNLTKLNARQAAYVYKVFKINHHMALVGLWHIKEELRKGFLKFSNKVPKHLNKKERRSYHPNHISNINYLDEHVFLNISFTSIKMISME